MGFGAEMQDFMAAYQVSSNIELKKDALDVDEDRYAAQTKLAADKQAESTRRFNATAAQKDRAFEATQKYRGLLTDNLATDNARADQDLARKTANDEANRAKTAADVARKKREAAEKADPAGAALGDYAIPEEGDAAPPDPTAGAQPIPQPNEQQAAGSLQQSLYDGFQYLQNAFGLNQGMQTQDPQANAGVRDLVMGSGARAQEEVAQMDQMIDPKGELAPQLKTIKRLTDAHAALLAKGKPEEAAAMAASLIQYSRMAAAMHGHAAEKKIQQGDLAGAAQSIIDAHNVIPDGKSVEFDPNSMTFRAVDDETGETLEEGQVTEEMLFNVANGLQGDLAYKLMYEAAKQHKSMKPAKGSTAAVKPDPAGQPMTQEQLGGYDEEEMKTQVINQITTNLRLPPDQAVQIVGEEGIDSIGDLAVMIAQHNGIRESDAAQLAFNIVEPPPNLTKGGEGPNQWNFKLIQGDQNVMEIMTENGTRLKLPARQAQALIVAANRPLTALALSQSDADLRGQISGDARQAETTRRDKAIADEYATQDFDDEAQQSIHRPSFRPSIMQPR